MAPQGGKEVSAGLLRALHGFAHLVKGLHLDHYMHDAQGMWAVEQGHGVLARVVGVHKVDLEAFHARRVEGVGQARADKLCVESSRRVEIGGGQYAVAKAQVACLREGGDETGDTGGGGQRDVVELAAPVQFQCITRGVLYRGECCDTAALRFFGSSCHHCVTSTSQ